MAKLDRIVAKIFGETADPTGVDPQIGQFGSARLGTYLGTGDVATIQNLPAWSNGWIAAVTPTQQFPTLPEMTGVHKVLSYHEAYLLQSGVPEWDNATTYYQDDFCRVGHTIYYSLQDENTNHNPTTDTLYWKDFAVGANQELSNLEDAGEDRLHALKGYLENGQSYTDTTLYNDVYHYNHSTFDLTKFTKAGSPIITDDGIASVTANGNMTQRVSIPFTFDLTAKKWSIISNFTTGSTVGAGYTIGSWQTNDSINCFHVGSYVFSFSIYVNIDGTRTQVASGNTSLPNLVQFRTNTKYIQVISRNNDTYTYSIYNASNPSENGTITITSEYDLFTANVLCVYSNASSSSLKSCNLKEVKVTVNDIPIFSGNKTGIDTIKPADYTVVGTPTISADGIASGFSSGNYLTTQIIDYTKPFDIYIRAKKDQTGSDYTRLIGFNGANDNVNIIQFTGLSNNKYKIGFVLNSISINITSDYVINPSEYYDYHVYWTGTVYGFEYKKATEDNYTSINTVASTTAFTSTSSTISIGYASGANSTGLILDLNSFKIYVNGGLVYQPCLLIPYSESSTGSKIVDVAYRDRVIDVYEQFGSANYYTIDEVNQNATLPMGEIYGFMPSITYW